MSYDEQLAERIRAVLNDQDLDTEVTEKKMFPGLAFLLGGHMTFGIVGTDLMLRLGEPAASQALQHAHDRPMDLTSRPMKAMIFVGPAGLREAALRRWITKATEHARSLPSKP
jgi:hypothetical protein